MDTEAPASPLPPSAAELLERISASLLDAGVLAVGVCSVEVLGEARSVLERRRDAGLHGGMQFTYRNPERSTDPRRTLPGARSAVVAAMPYRQHRTERPAGLQAEVARYAAEDTYGALRSALDRVVGELRSAGHRGVVVVDDNALVDRAMALRAGLGWIGRNSNLLVPGAGSWVVLGNVLTDADLPVARRFRDHPEPSANPGARVAADRRIQAGCGSCTRCIGECPTGAIVAPGVLDPSRCISWLLQRTGDFPREHRIALGARIYGCDECQSTCPPSSAAPVREPAVEAVGIRGRTERATSHWVDLAALLEMDDEELIARFGAWYLPRRDPRYLRRNALVVLGNLAAGTRRAPAGGEAAERERARELLDRYLGDEDPLLVSHAAWAARRGGFEDLLHSDAHRRRPEVLAELARPLWSRDNGADASA
ncbi:MAG: DUF1730 domain-containing protein [Microthrixaceae bacterium]